MTFTERIQKDFTTITLVLIPVAIVINIVIGQIVQVVLKLPIYLDSIGTVLVGALAGPLAGAITGAVSNLIWAIIFSTPQAAPYAITAFVIGICAGVFASRRAFKNIAWTIVAVAYFQATGANILQAATIQGFISDPLDKTISYLVVWLIVRGMSKRLVSQFPRSENVIEQ
ncbi:MAG: ECF transporter S component [Chloroflexi bacterium]|nr:ECF transporter S component [Chloroflexota bacterium]